MVRRLYDIETSDNNVYDVKTESKGLLNRVLRNVYSEDSVVIVGDYGAGKTTILGDIANILGIDVNHVSEINDPVRVGYGKWPKGDVILVDEASTEPMGIRSSYKSAIVGTHNEGIGRQYVNLLTGNKDPNIYYIIRSF